MDLSDEADINKDDKSSNNRVMMKKSCDDCEDDEGLTNTDVNPG